MTHRSPEFTARRLYELGAPDLLVRIALGEKAPGALEYELQTPRIFYRVAEDLSRKMPFQESLIPLWETNGDCVTCYVDSSRPQVITYCYEDPPDEFEVVGESILEAIEHRLAWLLCECGYGPAEVRAAAVACGHPSPEKFLHRVQAESEQD